MDDRGRKNILQVVLSIFYEKDQNVFIFFSLFILNMPYQSFCTIFCILYTTK